MRSALQPAGPLRLALRWAVAGTALCLVLVLGDLHRNGGNPVSLIQPGLLGPSLEDVRGDFPDTPVLSSTGHDGQIFYAMARQPMHLDELEGSLDRPQYRLQRPLYPWLAWALHPMGGGLGLIAALVAVNLAGLVLGGVAAGAISARLGGPVWPAAAFPLLPGSWVSLRISTADALAVAAALTAVALSLHGRHRLAVLAAVAAALTKEPSVLLLAGFALWRRDRAGWTLAAAGAGAAGGLALALRVSVGRGLAGVTEFGVPFDGMARAVARWWGQGDELWALASVAVAMGLGLMVLARRRLRSPLGWILALQLLFVALFGPIVVGLNLNATRATLPLLAFALVAAAAPGVRRPPAAPA